ncbi:serine/threonine-protein phosphatase 4 regulatory subunit 2 [Folsomia candida]|uniref:Serine/threonine-protein phosphatase 4 regulatory subunit 2 n=1 Tax=Folsomia candida TaxID=158441 RepID=A0A226D4H3_FOLCA|nr:serine/threonine-protein phosphatase 4 regulatory subunit 2 [Folsomia candida]OXA40465.1 Serine/threonine-protein phosphatase 4 regulatory subunit 2 [Folsomia candida]
MRGNMGEGGDILLDDLEGLLREINEFSATGNSKPEDIPQSIDRYLQFVAKSGNIVFPWQHVRFLFRVKILHAMEQFPGEPNPNSESFVMERFDLFRSAPFTIQRLTELVMQPTRHYKKKDKFLRGLEKTVLVVSTVEPWSLDADMKNGNESGSDGEMDQTYSDGDERNSIVHEVQNLVNIDPPVSGTSVVLEMQNLANVDHSVSGSSVVLEMQTLASIDPPAPANAQEVQNLANIDPPAPVNVQEMHLANLDPPSTAEHIVQEMSNLANIEAPATVDHVVHEPQTLANLDHPATGDHVQELQSLANIDTPATEDSIAQEAQDLANLDHSGDHIIHDVQNLANLDHPATGDNVVEEMQNLPIIDHPATGDLIVQEVQNLANLDPPTNPILQEVQNLANLDDDAALFSDNV